MFLGFLRFTAYGQYETQQEQIWNQIRQREFAIYTFLVDDFGIHPQRAKSEKVGGTLKCETVDANLAQHRGNRQHNMGKI